MGADVPFATGLPWTAEPEAEVRTREILEGPDPVDEAPSIAFWDVAPRDVVLFAVDDAEVAGGVFDDVDPPDVGEADVEVADVADDMTAEVVEL